MARNGAAASLLKQTWEGLLDHVYPPCCLICEQYNCPVICDACSAAFQSVAEPVCAVCGRPVTEGSPCRECEEAFANNPLGWGFDAARAAGIYGGPLRYAIHALKYRGAELLGAPLGAYLANRVIADELLPLDKLNRVDAVIPLPLHPARERRRGFNQSALLAKPVAEMRGVPLLTQAVRRVRKAPPQVGLLPETRRRNVAQGMFAADTLLVAGKTFLLVDDVFTTGATTSACAFALKEAGAKSVYVVTLAAGG